MNDPAEASIRISQLQKQNEELLCFMAPSPAQQQKIQSNCLEIAKLALRIHDYYKVKG